MNELVRFESEKQIEARSTSFVELIRDQKITNREEYALAATYFIDERAMEAAIVEHFKDMKADADRAHKTICAKEQSYLKPLRTALAMLKPRMSAWEQKEAERARKAEETARAKADKIEEKTGVAQVVLPVENKAHGQGVQFVDHWKADRIEIMALAKAVAAGNVPSSMLAPNWPELNKYASAMGPNAKMDGVTFVNERIVKKASA
jgi:hypothetical protein